MNIPAPWASRCCAVIAACAVVQTAQAQSRTVQSPAGASAARANSDITVTATRISRPIDLDGRLDDEIYGMVPAIGGFIQQEPREGALTTEATDIWVFFDEKNLYIAARCADSQPEREVATELRHDNSNIVSNENFAVILDTFHDRRNAVSFQVNPIGGYRESAIVDTVASESWNTIWEVRTDRSDAGWTTEMTIPFKSLRYASAGPQTWGINFRRVIKWKNENTYLTPTPAAMGLNAFSHMELAATLVGLETPRQSMNLELKPYVVSSLTTDRSAAQPFANSKDGNLGFDFKYGVTRGLTLDATVRTDFAQVEEDLQQVNLTRFSLFFPEKRDFFLEGQGIFAFGGVAFGNSNMTNPGDVPVLFFSRQIGLSKGQDVPVIAGARLTGRTGKYQVGAVNIQTDDKPAASAVATNFTAVRVKRDVLRRSTIGVLATRRSPAVAGIDQNLAFGVDATLGFYKNVSANAFYARTDTPGRRGNQSSYWGRYEYAGDRYGVVGEHLLIGAAFNPEVGFARRVDFRRSFEQLRFSPRPRRSARVRKYSFTGSFDYVTDAAVTRVQNKELRGQFNTEYQNGDSMLFDYTSDYELLPAKFVINPGTTVPQGGYDAQNIRVQYTLGVQHTVSGRLSVAQGTLYNGRKTEAGYVGRIGLIPQFALEPSVSLNWVRLPYGDFEAPVVSTRVIFTPNPRTALSSLIQYNGSSHVMSSSVRLRWEYRPSSEIFLVYSDGRNTLVSGYPDLLNRSLALKVTRLVRF